MTIIEYLRKKARVLSAAVSVALTLCTESADEPTQRSARAAAPMIGPCPDG